MKRQINIFCVLLALYGCTTTTTDKKNTPKHNLVFKACGYTRQMFFYGEGNPYVATVKTIGNEFVLTVTDTITNREVVLKSDNPITIKGGDIKYKK